jgi:uncharacterized protein YwgA
MKPDPYAQTYRGIKLDPYRILEIYGITHPAQQHALKKLLRAGRSHKALHQDIDEVIDSLNRWKEMVQEDLPTTEDIQKIYRETKAKDSGINVEEK